MTALVLAAVLGLAGCAGAAASTLSASSAIGPPPASVVMLSQAQIAEIEG